MEMLGSSTGASMRRIGFVFLAATSLVISAMSAEGQEQPAAQAPASTGAAAPAAATPSPTAPDDAFTEAELRKLLAPFALFPDTLLAQLLPACAYPVDIVQAARWLDKNKSAVAKGDFSGADTQSWDPTVKALVRFPDIIARLNDDLDMTTDLGDAFVNQPDDVAAVIQHLRREAQKAGSLKTTKQQKVTVQDQGGTDYVVIEPADPGVIYVPTYDPQTVYYDSGDALAAGIIGFGAGIAVGIAIDNAWDWGRGWVYPPRWPGYPGYRPGGGNNINIGNDINIGGGTRPWRPDGDRYRPGQGTKPGLANRPDAGNRPGVDRPSAGNRPEIGQRPAAGNRPGGGDRPSAGNRPDRPASANKGQRPGSGGGKQAAKRPAKETAFSNAKMGGKGSKAVSNRGSSSRQSVARPSGGRQQVNRGGGRPQQIHRGGGGRPQMNRGGGGRPQMHRGGGGGRGGRR
jgi:hypothetical protein